MEHDETTWDHRQLTIDEPIAFSEREPGALWLELPCEPHHDLDWSLELERAKNAGRNIVWKFALGLESPFFPLEDELRFQAISLALAQFSKEVWPEFKDKTVALSLYRGAADLSEKFLWTDKQRANYSEWREGEDNALARKLFCIDAFAVYFQMLSHRLPDEVPVFLLFEPLSSISETLQVLSKERFEHFLIALRGESIARDGYIWNERGIFKRTVETKRGIVFPNKLESMSLFDEALKEAGSVKVVYESFLTEEWDGLDSLIVLPGSLGSQGERKLKGFLASGGEVVVRGRGI